MYSLPNLSFKKSINMCLWSCMIYLFWKRYRNRHALTHLIQNRSTINSMLKFQTTLNHSKIINIFFSRSHLIRNHENTLLRYLILICSTSKVSSSQTFSPEKISNLWFITLLILFSFIKLLILHSSREIFLNNSFYP